LEDTSNQKNCLYALIANFEAHFESFSKSGSKDLVISAALS
jgi:hypothetical protein